MAKPMITQTFLCLFLLVVFGFIVQFGWYIKRPHMDKALEKIRRNVLQNSTSLPTPASSQTLHPTPFSSASTNVRKTPIPTPVSLSSTQDDSLNSLTDQNLLVVVVLSKERDRRDAIRETWKSTHYHTPHYNVTVKFSLGTLGLNSSEIEDLESEELEHEDLILLPQLYDSYTNLTRKILYSLEWVEQHLQYSYLLKCDDDSFALLDRIAHEVNNMSPERGLFWGYFIGYAKPYSEGVWAENSWFACDTYFPYAFGGGYVLSASVVHGIVLNADGLSIYSSEDVSMGMWTASFDIERKHDVRFDVEHVSRGCSNDFLVTHKQSIEDMYKKHNLLLRRNVLCEKEGVWKYYMYKWSRKPSRCCKTKYRRLY